MTEAIRANNDARPQAQRWRRILVSWWRELDRDHVSVMAAGVGFYSFLSIFPAMSAAISIYGLLGDPHIIARQVASLRGVLPRTAMQLMTTELQTLIAAPRAGLGIGLVISLLVTIWSAMYGATTLMQALTVAYNDEEQRGIVAFYSQAAGLTIGLVVFGVLSLLLVAVIPAVLQMAPIPSPWRGAVALTRWPLLAALVYVALTLVYRFAPSRKARQWHWLAPGTIAAALCWLVGSAGFSRYVAEFPSYNKAYGTLGAVVILMMWFYYTAYIVLAGAELNAEHQKADATAEQPAVQCEPEEHVALIHCPSDDDDRLAGHDV